MNRINVNINALRSIAETRSVAWGTRVWHDQGMTWGGNTGALVFAAVLIVCSLTVGCSSDKPKPVSNNNPISAPQIQGPAMPAPTMQAESKPVPAPKKVVHKKPATVNYADKTYGVTFEYPRRYAIETGNAATEMLASNPIAMNFVQPGGVALAAVELPETSFANTDFSSAFFNVSVNKTLTADQCREFAVPQPKVATTPATSTEPATASASSVQTESASSAPASKSDSQPAPTPSNDLASASKLMLGDLELRATEAVSG